MTDIVKIPKGALLTVTTGEYSDFTVHGVFRALEEIDHDKLAKEWLAIHPEQKGQYEFDNREFLCDLVRRNLIEQIECWELYLSGYGTIDDMFVSQMKGTLP